MKTECILQDDRGKKYLVTLRSKFYFTFSEPEISVKNCPASLRNKVDKWLSTIKLPLRCEVRCYPRKN